MPNDNKLIWSKELWEQQQCASPNQLVITDNRESQSLMIQDSDQIKILKLN